MPVLIGGVIAAIVVAAGAGLVFAGGNDGPQPTTQRLPTPGPTQVVVVSTPGPVVSLQPLPTAGVVNPTPGPVAPTPGPNPGGDTKIISVEYVAVTVPSAWEILDQQPTLITMYAPEGGVMHLESGFVDTAVTAEDLVSAAVQRHVAKYPDVEVCIERAEDVLPNGPESSSVGLCYTATTQSGKTYPATMYFRYGVSDGGTTIYVLKIFSADDDWDAVVDAVVPVFDTIQWKLYAGN